MRAISKKFDACTRCSLSDGFKQEQKEVEKIERGRSQSKGITKKRPIDTGIHHSIGHSDSFNISMM